MRFDSMFVRENPGTFLACECLCMRCNVCYQTEVVVFNVQVKFAFVFDPDVQTTLVVPSGFNENTDMDTSNNSSSSQRSPSTQEALRVNILIVISLLLPL